MIGKIAEGSVDKSHRFKKLCKLLGQGAEVAVVYTGCVGYTICIGGGDESHDARSLSLDRNGLIALYEFFCKHIFVSTLPKVLNEFEDYIRQCPATNDLVHLLHMVKHGWEYDITSFDRGVVGGCVRVIFTRKLDKVVNSLTVTKFFQAGKELEALKLQLENYNLLVNKRVIASQPKEGGVDIGRQNVFVQDLKRELDEFSLGGGSSKPSTSLCGKSSGEMLDVAYGR